MCPEVCIYNAEMLSMCNKHLMLNPAPVMYNHTYTHTHIHSTLSLSSTVLCKHPRETQTLTEAKARQKCRPAGPTMCCFSNQAPCIEEKQRVGQTAVRYTQKATYIYIYTYIHTYINITHTHTHTHIHTHTHNYACLYV